MRVRFPLTAWWSMKKPDPGWRLRHEWRNRFTHGANVERLIVAFELKNPETCCGDRHVKLCASHTSLRPRGISGRYLVSQKARLQAAAKEGAQFAYRRTAPTNRFTQ